MSIDLFPHLEFEINDRWQSFPSWTKCFYEVGTWLAEENNPGQRTVVALSIPIRVLAPSLVALGLVSALSRRAVEESLADDYFSYLASTFTEDTGVILTENGRQFLGVIDGITPVGNEQWLKVRVENAKNSALWHFIGPRKAKTIKVAQVSLSDLPERQKGRKVGSTSDFSRNFLPELDFVNFLNSETLDCTIVGRQSLLCYELVETNIRINYKGRITLGSFQDVVRAKPLRLSHLAPRAEIWKIPTRSSIKPPQNSKVAIFDGAAAFIRCSAYFPKCNWVVLLDRTDPGCNLGFETINSRYVQHRLDPEEVREFPALPDGVEATVFWESLS